MRQKIMIGLWLLLPVMAVFSALTLAALLGVFALLCVDYSRRALWRVRQEKTVWILLACLLLWPLVSILWSPAPAGSLLAWGRTFATCVLGMLAWRAGTHPALSDRALRTMALTFAGLAVILMLQRWVTPGVISVFGAVTGWASDVYLSKGINRGLCALSVLVWPLVFGLVRRHKRGWAWVVFLLTAAVLGSLHSLSAQVGLVAGLLALMLAWAMPQTFSRVVVIAVPLLFFVGPLLTQLFLHSAFTTEHMAKLQLLSDGRIPVWQIAEQAAGRRPWFGYGINSSAFIPADPALLLASGLPTPAIHPHHSMLQVWLELGMVGLLLTSVALALLLQHLRSIFVEDRAAQAAVLATVIAYLGTGFSSFSIWQSWWVTMPWILLLLWQKMLRMPRI